MKLVHAALVFALAPLLLLTGCLSFHPGRPPGQPKMGSFTRLGNETYRFVDTQDSGARPLGVATNGSAAPSAKSKGTVMLVHGFGATIEEWAPVIPVLSQHGYRVIALDLLGHGYSGRPDADYSIPAQARRVVAFANQRGVDKFAIVGHSWGSAVSMAVTIAAPQRVTRVALYNGMFFEDQQPTLFSWARVPGLGEVIYGVFYPDRQDEKMAYAFYDPEKHITEEMVEDVEGLLDRPGGLAAALAGVRAMRYTELEARYRTVQQPVLLMWGRDDNVTPLPYGERLLKQLPNGRLVVYPQCGHLPMLEVPGPSTHELLRFLGEGAT